MTRSVLITGGAGFIGAHLAERLLGQGTHVTIYDNFHPQLGGINRTNAARLRGMGVTVAQGDICDAPALRAALAEAAPDHIYHLAAETGTGQSNDAPVRYTEANVTGTAHLIEALRVTAAPVGRVILTSSRAVYGEGACVDDQGIPTLAQPRRLCDLTKGDYAPKDAQARRLTPVATTAQCPPQPVSIYGATKLMQEQMLTQALHDTPTDLGVLRLHNVYGPGQALANPYTGVLSVFARRIAQGETLDIYEDGQITRDFVFVQDVVRALTRMGEIAVLPPQILDIGTGVPRTILETAQLMLTKMGAAPDRLQITGTVRPGDIRHALADTRAAKRHLGWHAQTDLSTGLDHLIHWATTAQAGTA